MTDQKKPEALADEELEGAQGGLLGTIMGTQAPQQPGAGVGSLGTSTTFSLKQPTTRMEEENPDE